MLFSGAGKIVIKISAKTIGSLHLQCFRARALIRLVIITVAAGVSRNTGPVGGLQSEIQTLQLQRQRYLQKAAGGERRETRKNKTTGERRS